MENNLVTVNFVKFDECAASPHYATGHSAGMDLSSIEDRIIEAGKHAVVGTGLGIALPDGYEAQVRPRSGLAAKHQITVLNSPGTIDADYRGEIKVILMNHSNESFRVEKGMRIAQLVVAKYSRVAFMLVDSLEDTERGTGGFGSTGL